MILTFELNLNRVKVNQHPDI